MMDRGVSFDGGEKKGEDKRKEKKGRGRKRLRFLGCHSILHPMDSPPKSCSPLSPSPPSPHMRRLLRPPPLFLRLVRPSSSSQPSLSPAPAAAAVALVRAACSFYRLQFSFGDGNPGLSGSWVSSPCFPGSI